MKNLIALFLCLILAGPCFAAGYATGSGYDNGLGGSGGSGSGTVASGTTGQEAKYTGATTTGSGNITDNGNIGIGSTNPGQALDVQGTVRMTGFQIISGAGAGKVLQSDASGKGTWATNSGTNYWVTGNVGINTTNNVGIGSLSPGQALDVNGTVRTVGFTATGNGTVGGTLGVTGHVTVEATTSTGATGANKFVFDTNPLLQGNVGVGTSLAGNTLWVNGGVTAQNYTAYGSGSSYTNGNLGIGTTTSTGVTAPLVVFGNVGVGSVNPANSIDVGTGSICLNHVCDSTWPGGTPGGGTTAQIQYYSNSTTFGGITNTATSGGNIGIGTFTTPSVALLQLGSSGQTNIFSNGNVGIGTGAAGNTLVVNGAAQIIGSGVSSFTGGNVGIGTTLSTNLLDVQGGVSIGTTNAGYKTAPVNGLLVQGNVGIGTYVDNTGAIQINKATNASGVGDAIGLCASGSGYCIGYCTTGTYPTCGTCTCLAK